MYLSILILPLLGSIISGFMGRKIGVTGAHLITCTCLILASILSTIAFYEVGICGSPVSINLVSWVDSEFMSIKWEFLFDQLTVSMFLPVLYISSLIHIFSTDYMSEDPHNQRFFSYLSLFTFFMLLLVSGANYFVMFVGWEGIGIVSYLLINFWFTRIQANKAAILALTMNRVGALWSRISLLCQKLSNSGNTLKLMIPSDSRKAISGWSNYSGKVISHKMSENEIGYRGSKSVFINTVKEQRVDGSWCKNLLRLRCTLMGFERNYQIKILSKQLNKNKRKFTTLVKNYKINPWFVTGFTDAEGSFGISIIIDKRIKGRLGWAIKPSFQISLNSKDINLLLQLQEFFGCGVIINKNTRNESSFRVNSTQNLTNYIIPHFLNYPLLSKKAADFILFSKIIKLINDKIHLTENGLQQIINLKASINLGLSDLLKSNFPKYNPVARPIINSTKILDPNWISGFASGDGCFLLSIFKSKKIKTGYVIQLIFKLTQHKKDKNLLELIAKFLNCGTVYLHSENAFVYTVSNFTDIKKIIIPIFKVHPIQGIKQLDFQDFCKVADLIDKDKHLNIEGLAQILLIKDRMNTKRK